MEWYYVKDGKPAGPISEAEFVGLVRSGGITPETLVWHAGMAEWQACGTVAESPAAAGAAAGTLCAECGRAFPDEQMITYGTQRVCAGCKDVFFQKIKEGVAPGRMVYAGFMVRWGAKIIDGIILGIFNFIVGMLGGLLIARMQAGQPSKGVFGPAFGVQVVLWVIQMAVQVVFTTWFIGRYGATPGKMVCGLKVVTAEGGKVSYGRACGRAFAEWLSAMILYIGYLMAAYDDERRTLHDRICNTRVIRK